MKDLYYIVAIVLLLFFTGRWDELWLIYKWLLKGELTIEEVEVEVVTEEDFWRAG